MAKRGPYRKQKDRPPLAQYLVSVRVEKGLTQQEIAIKLGRTRGSICRIESGNRQRKCLQGYILYELAEAYGAPLGEVLKKADWPQLLLVNAGEEERQELIRYLKDNL